MKILHYIPTIDSTAGITSKYMAVLCSMSGRNAETHIVCGNSPQPIPINNATIHFIPQSYLHYSQIRTVWLKTLYEVMPDIVHVHGCWSADCARIINLSARRGFRTVLSPQGGLEPWIFKQRLWTEKIPKTVLYQWLAVRRAFVIHVSGVMEYESMRSLGWNKRIAVVKNSLITGETDDKRMCEEMTALYQKILDTDVYRLMKRNTHETFSKILHAGMTKEGDATITGIEDEGWRKMMIFARTEHIYDLFLKGCNVLKISLPNIDVNSIETFSKRECAKGNAIEESDGTLTNEQRITALLSKIRKGFICSNVNLSTLCQLSLLLRNTEYDEDQLRQVIRSKRLTKMMGRMEQILSEFIGLEEGFMPVEQIDDIITKRLKKIIAKELTI